MGAGSATNRGKEPPGRTSAGPIARTTATTMPAVNSPMPSSSPPRPVIAGRPPRRREAGAGSPSWAAQPAPTRRRWRLKLTCTTHT